MKIKSENDEINGGVSKETSSALDEEEARLRARAANPSDAFAMAALGRFLQVKRGDIRQGSEWHRRAVDTVAGKLSANLDPTIQYC